MFCWFIQSSCWQRTFPLLYCGKCSPAEKLLHGCSVTNPQEANFQSATEPKMFFSFIIHLWWLAHWFSKHSMCKAVLFLREADWPLLYPVFLLILAYRVCVDQRSSRTLALAYTLQTSYNFTTNLHVFGLWEETGKPGETPHSHRENVQTLCG